MTPRTIDQRSLGSARQRVVVLTFATVDEANRFDVEAEWYGVRFAIAALVASATIEERS